MNAKIFGKSRTVSFLQIHNEFINETINLLESKEVTPEQKKILVDNAKCYIQSNAL